MLSLQQFRVLLAIRDHGSLTRAAAALQHGVPTVTHHLDALERHLRTQLVDRGRSGAQLTSLGQAFAAEVEQILARVTQAERVVTDHRDAGLTTLRIGTFASIGSRILPSAIAQLQVSMPVRVEVVEAEPIEIVRLIKRGDVHAGLIYDFADDPAFESQDLTLSRLIDEPYEILIAKRGRFAELEQLDFAQLREVTWIWSRNDDEASCRVLQRVCRSVGYEPRALMRTDDLNMIHGLVAQGLGLALSTAAAVDPRFDVVLRPSIQELGLRRTSFARLRGPVTPAVRKLGELLERTAHLAATGDPMRAPAPGSTWAAARRH